MRICWLSFPFCLVYMCKLEENPRYFAICHRVTLSVSQSKLFITIWTSLFVGETTKKKTYYIFCIGIVSLSNIGTLSCLVLFQCCYYSMEDTGSVYVLFSLILANEILRMVNIFRTCSHITELNVWCLHVLHMLPIHVHTFQCAIQWHIYNTLLFLTPIWNRNIRFRLLFFFGKRAIVRKCNILKYTIDF